MTFPWRPVRGGLAIVVRVTPNAGVDRIDGIERRADGTAVLRVRVRATPERGKANAAVLALIASSLSLPKSAVSIDAGDKARLKTVRALGDPLALLARMEALAPPESG
jgi:uncharacterized protein YggU (UPF0235/DUF167 family)